MLSPLAASEVCVINPGLINIEYSFPFIQQLQHLYRPLLPEDQILLRVAVEGNLLDPLVLETDSLPQDIPYLSIGYN